MTSIPGSSVVTTEVSGEDILSS